MGGHNSECMCMGNLANLEGGTNRRLYLVNQSCRHGPILYKARCKMRSSIKQMAFKNAPKEAVLKLMGPLRAGAKRSLSIKSQLNHSVIFLWFCLIRRLLSPWVYERTEEDEFKVLKLFK